MNTTASPALVVINLMDTDTGTSDVLCIPLDGKDVPKDFLSALRSARDTGVHEKVIAICNTLHARYNMVGGMSIHGRLADSVFCFDLCNY